MYVQFSFYAQKIPDNNNRNNKNMRGKRRMKRTEKKPKKLRHNRSLKHIIPIHSHTYTFIRIENI